MTAPFTNKSMKEMLENVRIAINNSLKNADVLGKVLEFGGVRIPVNLLLRLRSYLKRPKLFT
jgi:hypothetical protein